MREKSASDYVTFEAPLKLVQRADLCAALVGINRSELIRRAVDDYIVKVLADLTDTPECSENGEPINEALP
jgi:hypothetical protein